MQLGLGYSASLNLPEVNFSVILIVSRITILLCFFYAATELLFRAASEVKEWGDSAFVLLVVKAYNCGQTFVDFAPQQSQQWSPGG